jgi:NAD+ synthase
VSGSGTVEADLLAIDPEKAVETIVASLREIVGKELRRRGGVVGVSGGIDSSVTLALCARAFGPNRTLGLLMPETDSSDDTLGLSQLVAGSLGVPTVLEDITPILRAARCYERRDEAVRRVIPEFGEGWRFKIVLPSVLGTDAYRLFTLVAQSPDGESVEARLPANEYLTIVAATNFKQRTRKMLEYYHADAHNYAVAGTPNRLEYDQGFFVKLGDGAADVKPIAHLYKTQVYRLAEYLEIPEEVRSRKPTTDTYSLAQTQDEFYFSLPYAEMDLCLYGHNNGIPAAELASKIGISADDVSRVYEDVEQKRRTTRYLHLGAQLVEPVPEVPAKPS